MGRAESAGAGAGEGEGVGGRVTGERRMGGRESQRRRPRLVAQIDFSR